jgi:hypothetical protein
MIGLLHEGGKKYTVGQIFETTTDRQAALVKAKFVEAVAGPAKEEKEKTE